MGLGGDALKKESWDVGKSKGRKKKDGDSEEETGCWIKLRFIGSCMSSRSKVDSSISSISTHCGNALTCSFNFYLFIFYISTGMSLLNSIFVFFYVAVVCDCYIC